MDILYIHDLRIDTVIGVYDWERRIRQTVVFDIDLSVDVRKAAAADGIAGAIDYGQVAQRVIAFVETSQFTLVETLAEKVAEIIQNEFKVPWMRLKLNKQGAVRGVRDVGVVIERGKK
jgi:dihydroneopterin aldolase